MNYLTGIQFPPFPEKGLSRDRIADLYNARKLISIILTLIVGDTSHNNAVATSFRILYSYLD
jgi:hypothetical protein